MKKSKIKLLTLEQKGMGMKECGEPQRLKVIEKVVFYSTTYPELEITQFDLCDNLEEEVGLWIKLSCEIKKKDLFKFIQVLGSNFELCHDERLPAKITIETKFKKKGQERYRKKLEVLKNEK